MDGLEVSWGDGTSSGFGGKRGAGGTIHRWEVDCQFAAPGSLYHDVTRAKRSPGPGPSDDPLCRVQATPSYAIASILARIEYRTKTVGAATGFADRSRLK